MTTIIPDVFTRQQSFLVTYYTTPAGLPVIASALFTRELDAQGFFCRLERRDDVVEARIYGGMRELGRIDNRPGVGSMKAADRPRSPLARPAATA